MAPRRDSFSGVRLPPRMGLEKQSFSEAAKKTSTGDRVLNQPYFILVLAHSLHGRLRRIHVPYQFVYAVLALALVGAVSLLGFV